MKSLFTAVLLIITWKLGLTFLDATQQRIVNNAVDKYLYVLDTSGVLFPRVALAQNILETGMFGSRVCRENHNLFGMKESSRQWDIGTKNGHANYPHIRHDGNCTIACYEPSIKDYRDWQRAFRVHERCKTEEEYIYYLQHLPGNRRYAEDRRYGEKLSSIIKLIR